MPKIKINNINLYYESYGEGEPIVFITGFSGDHTVWKNIAIAYSKNYRTIVFDNRGIGQTDCPDYPYTMEMMADDTAGLIQALQLEKAHIIGGSMGGFIAQALAYKYPALIKSAVIANAAAKWNIRAQLYTYVRLEMIEANVPMASIIKLISMLCWSENYLSQPGMIEQLVRQGWYPMSISGYKNQLNALENFDSTAWLHTIKTPCLVITGDEDLLITAEQAKQVADAIPHAKYFCFKNVGHVPQVEQPELFNQLALAFIAKHNN